MCRLASKPRPPEGTSSPWIRACGGIPDVYKRQAIAAEEITFTFDTVFIVRKTSPHKGLEAFEAYLNSIGDSLVIGEDDEIGRAHV